MSGQLNRAEKRSRSERNDLIEISAAWRRSGRYSRNRVDYKRWKARAERRVGQLEASSVVFCEDCRAPMHDGACEWWCGECG